MSLNGLDSPSVLEAYHHALADAGGWFLLHYTARDEVALLDRGTGGVPDVRNAVDNYNEVSPLYGFLHYRRRKVILRYMPEGLSRLLLARSNVQFQSMLDKFTPHDTVLPITSASDLNESALSAACLLHTASGSALCASNSVRGRRLKEITEDVEENATKEEVQDQSALNMLSQIQPQTQTQPVSRQTTSLPKEEEKSVATLVPFPSSPSRDIEYSSPDLPIPPSRASSRSPLSFSSTVEPHEDTTSPISPRSPQSITSEQSRYKNILDEFPRPSEEIRMSSQSARPSLRELERAAGHTHKVKLGPRPVVDQSGRPRTSGSSRNSEQRPVAPMPAGMRSSSVRKPSPNTPDPFRPRSQGSAFAIKPSSRAPPVPPLLVPPSSVPLARPPLSPGAKSLGALSTSSGLTPEKERLMKALQQRKKQMAKRAEELKKKKKEEEEQAESEELVAASKPADSVDGTRHGPSLCLGMTNGPSSRTIQRLEASHEPTGQAIISGPSAPVEQHAGSTAKAQVQLGDMVSATTAHAQPVSDVPLPGSRMSHDVPGPDIQIASSSDMSHCDSAGNAEASIMSDSDCQTSDRYGASADTDPSLGCAVPLIDITKAASQISPEIEVSEHESAAEHTESTPPDPIEAQGELVPPSANAEVPLTEEAANFPNSTPALKHTTSPVQQSEIDPVLDGDRREAHTAKAGLAEVDQTHGADILSPVEPCSNPTAAPLVTPVEVSVEPVVHKPNASEEELSSTPAPAVPPLDRRRKKYLEPIQVPAQEFSDDDCLLSDDSFMEELRSATVEEARPVSVKSPNGGDQSWKGPRAASGPYLSSTTAGQSLTVGRSVSSSHVEKGSPSPVLVAKKINVSSGISSRIKALEKFQTREGSPSGATLVPGPSASSSFEELRKRASVQVPNGTTLPDFSRAPSVNHHDVRPVSSAAHRRTTSVSVTARTVRDSSASPDSSAVQSPEAEPLGLPSSSLTVEQHEVSEAESPDLTAARPATVSPVEDRSMSMSSVGSYFHSSPVSRPASRLSISSRSKTEENPITVTPPEEKKDSRASRLMRRVSSITSTSRRNIVGALTSPVKEESSAVSPPAETVVSASSSSEQTLFEPVDIGEVNVQFPGTLLWKRRFMRVDSDGYLVLTPAAHDTSARNMIKRYHLSEFRAPCLPDEDMQELPNSIVLDFLDGSTLQCACESRQGQTWTLQTLRDAHGAYQQ
ncbi:hypothetical protein N7539_003880 [Penicillium diatomitis]|uniref:GPI-anchored cell surface glycoprotein n=1 Tax=Penicillium diatomitis TaxID=2819901 RepID=A0A9W9XCR8_9EURO|nr:uncharacterized protein N7539_003880 [Penicillium diatomitis]KAJ5488990.1 hypothetical protein N7539_003880 [Penicillium diatomitis]